MLKVDHGSSYCDTPSERNGPPRFVEVKVGCLHINPASKNGQRLFMLQMIFLCFLPHAALIAQNCTIMAQLSRTLDSSLYLSDEVNATLTLGQLVLSLQLERNLIAKFLLKNAEFNRSTLMEAIAVTNRYLQVVPNSMQLYNFSIYFISYITHPVRHYHLCKNFHNEDMSKLWDGINVYETSNTAILFYIFEHAKLSVFSLWRQLTASYELLKSLECVSLSLTTFSRLSHEAFEVRTLVQFEKYHALATEHLRLTTQYLISEKLTHEVEEIRSITKLYEKQLLVKWNTNNIGGFLEETVMKKHLENLEMCFVEMRLFYMRFLDVLKVTVSREVWLARQTLSIGMVILIVVLAAAPGLILLLRHTVNTLQIFNESVERSNQCLIAEKQKSDLLLSRMLPLPVLRRLRAQRAVPAEAFEAVTIFFSDIVGFTNISATSTPLEIINMLNMLYRLFDERIMQYDVYKVETIGDAYMVVSGLPQRNENKHASEIADMALSLMRSLQGARVPHRPEEMLQIRAGVNTGPCVAGVVGTTMPRYCLFGDAINTASRMESTGEAMKIHISHTTKLALDTIGNYETQYRGIMNVPGKGDMETYWLIDKTGDLRSESPRCLRFQDYDVNVLELLIKS